MEYQNQILQAIELLTPKQIEALKKVIEEQHPTPKPIWFSPFVHFQRSHKNSWTSEIESLTYKGEITKDEMGDGSDKYYEGRLYLDKDIKITPESKSRITYTLFTFDERRYKELYQVEYKNEQSSAAWKKDLMPEIKKYFLTTKK